MTFQAEVLGTSLESLCSSLLSPGCRRLVVGTISLVILASSNLGDILDEFRIVPIVTMSALI